MFGLLSILLVSVNSTLIQYTTSGSSSCLILKQNWDMAVGIKPLFLILFLLFHTIAISALIGVRDFEPWQRVIRIMAVLRET